MNKWTKLQSNSLFDILMGNKKKNYKKNLQIKYEFINK